MDDLILAYLNGEATREEATCLLAWVRECPENRDYFMEFRDLWITTGHVLSPDHKKKEAFHTFKTQILFRERAHKKKRFTLRCIKWVAAVAVCLLGSVSFYLAQENRRTDSLELPRYALNRISTEKNRHSIVLTDGTVVWLNTNSTLAYPDTFPPHKRIVELEGEAYFEVSRDESAPFYVKTKHMEIKVLGTCFDVQCYGNKRVSETVLLSGKVEVNLPVGNKQVVLTPDQKISWNKKTKEYEVVEINAEAYAVWTQDKLILQDEELEHVFNKLSRWYGIEIVYDGNLGRQSKYSLTVRDEPKEKILNLLSQIAHFEYEIKEDQIVIQR